MPSKRVVILSDSHCGSRTGLTPPKWQSLYDINKDQSEEAFMTQHFKFVRLQKDLWNFYKKTIDSLKPIDVLIFNGDAIEGKGEKSGGTELIASDCITQANIAIDCIKIAEAKKIYMTFGTDYHVTGKGEDFESLVADKVHAEKIGAHDCIEINKVRFDIKHHVGTSQSPTGRYSAITRDRLWNLIWNDNNGDQPRADVFIRSHCHYFVHCGDVRWLGIITPSLQAPGTKFGTRRCSGRVDFGLISFDINEKGKYTWQSHIADLPSLKAQVIVV
jgi:hypothetical protein